MDRTRMNREEVANWFRGLQDRICAGLEGLDGEGKFQQDEWQRPEGGGGRSRVIQGAVIEKGGVNFSAVEGPLPEKISDALKLPKTDFFATGVSIVLHPRSPMVPIIHMNVRFFDTGAGATWFGGGIDVTPHYIVDGDARAFHQHLKAVCDTHDPAYYPKFKSWADDYFYLKHRKETRGVGGIFFDRLSHSAEHSMQDRWAFTQDVGEAFVPIYRRLVEQNQSLPYGEKELEWQALRRSRYVEFNLVWDKGTKFGLDTDGRTESILMSMPPIAKWRYNYTPPTGSPEADTQAKLRKDIDWLNV